MNKSVSGSDLELMKVKLCPITETTHFFDREFRRSTNRSKEFMSALIPGWDPGEGAKLMYGSQRRLITLIFRCHRKEFQEIHDYAMTFHEWVWLRAPMGVFENLARTTRLLSQEYNMRRKSIKSYTAEYFKKRVGRRVCVHPNQVRHVIVAAFRNAVFVERYDTPTRVVAGSFQELCRNDNVVCYRYLLRGDSVLIQESGVSPDDGGFYLHPPAQSSIKRVVRHSVSAAIGECAGLPSTMCDLVNTYLI